MSRRNYSHISRLLAVFLLGSLVANSQSTLSRKVTDMQTGELVPYASVFFSHTTMGSSTLEVVWDETASNMLPIGYFI